MSDPSIDRHMMKASEEATRKNVIAAVDHANETRRQTQANAADVQRLSNTVNSLQAMLQQQLQAFASTTQRVYALEAELTELKRELHGDLD